MYYVKGVFTKNSTKSRKFQLTFNNPQEHGYSHEAIKNILSSFKNITYWCMCDEKGQTYHTHLYLYSPNAILFDVRYWLTVVQKKVDTVTYQGYELLANSHILPYFDAKGVKLQDVSRNMLQAYIDEKHASGRIDGKGGLSPASIRRHKNILRQTMEEAVKNGLLLANPCAGLILPKSERFEANFYTAEQLQRLFDAIRDEPIYPLVKITSIYGLRRSELWA